MNLKEEVVDKNTNFIYDLMLLMVEDKKSGFLK
jgi:hypothetical protein